MDDAFCTQLDGKLQAHQQELARQQADMQVQVDRANNKVITNQSNLHVKYMWHFVSPPSHSLSVIYSNLWFIPDADIAYIKSFIQKDRLLDE